MAGKARAACCEDHVNSKASVNWKDPALFAELKQYAAEKMSFTQIAAKLNKKFGLELTRSAVGGAMHRWGVTNNRGRYSPRPRVAKPTKNTWNSCSTRLKE